MLQNLPVSLFCRKYGKASYPKIDSSAVGMRVFARATYAVEKPISDMSTKIETI